MLLELHSKTPLLMVVVMLCHLMVGQLLNQDLSILQAQLSLHPREVCSWVKQPLMMLYTR